MKLTTQDAATMAAIQIGAMAVCAVALLFTKKTATLDTIMGDADRLAKAFTERMQRVLKEHEEQAARTPPTDPLRPTLSGRYKA